MAFVMPTFYFDFHDTNGLLRDEAGDELPSAVVARKEAIEAVGHVLKDLTFRHSDGRIKIEVRDDDGPILSVSGVVETTSLRE
jgi:hypothetical protein